MVKYFIIFTIIGFAIGRFIPSSKVGFCYIAFISVFWGSHSEVIWGLVALGELSLGYLVATIFVNSRTTATGASPAPPGQDKGRLTSQSDDSHTWPSATDAAGKSPELE